MQITLPIYWTQSFKTKPDKTWLCGMNAYRNWHYHTSSSWKNEFHQLVCDQLDTNKSFNQFILSIKLYYKNICDASNVVPLMEKVVLDTLQEQGILTNDNVNYHLGTCWEVAGCDKANPRCEITLKEVSNG